MEARVFKDTTATQKIFSLTKRIRAVCGGTSASKTISILIWIIDYAQSVENELVSIVSESYPHLEKGAMLDFESIMKSNGFWNQDRWNQTKHTYTFPKGTKVEFMSIDHYGKAHGPRRDVLFVNEAPNLPFNIVDQLITRTRKIVWMDWNPTNEFYFYTDMLPNRDDIDFLTLTYKDNEALDPITIKEIESHKYNKIWWQVYGLGQLGEVEGRIHRGWRILDSIPDTAHLKRYGLDYGYTNDPSAIVAIYYWNGAYVIDEVCYQKGMSNADLASIFTVQDKALVIADSSEPKSNDEIGSYGINIVGAFKGKDSVLHGIQYVQAQKIFITKRSLNVLKEYRNYMWMTDREGRILNEPDHAFSHSMDAIRYALSSFIIPEKKTQQSSPGWTSTRWNKTV